jgi:hypothetical protein
MLRIWLALIVGAGLLLVSGLVSTLAKAQAGTDPAAVITAYEMARNRRDLDAALTYFADDATVSQRATMYAGKDEIRKFLDTASARSRFVVVSDRHSSGNRVTWSERTGGATTTQGQSQGGGLNGALVASNSGGTTSAFVVNVEAVVQDGKIRSVAYLSGNQVARLDPALDGRAQLPATAGLGAVALVLLGALTIASIGGGWRRPALTDSSLRGHLLRDLRGWSATRQQQPLSS